MGGGAKEIYIYSGQAGFAKQQKLRAEGGKRAARDPLGCTGKV